MITINHYFFPIVMKGNKFGPLEVKKVIEKSENFKVTAVAIAAIKCPQHIVK